MNDDLERAEARIGRVLNEKWMLEQLLGLGGMAAVYRARHRNGARAAVKILHADLSRNAEIRRRFVHEAKAANRVEHPGAVSIIDDDVVKSGEDADAAFLVMELLEGESVSSRLEAVGGRMSEAEVLAIAKQVLDVLEAAHQRGIIHRDLKPDNLFLVRDPTLDVQTGFPWTRVKVLDFGIARARDEGDAHRTKTGAMLGTPAYMSPEQALGKQDEIDGRTDLYALGATMFRLLTGRKVHESSSSNEAMIKVATERARPLRTIVPESSASVANIVDRALRFGRDERYPNAAAMRDDVRAAMSMRPASAPFPTAIATEPTLAIAATLQREPPVPPRRPIALFAVLGAALLLFVVLGVAYALWPAPHDDDAGETQEKRSQQEPEPAEPELSASAAPEPSVTAAKPAPKPTTPKKPAFESDGKGGWKKKN
jgi:serine/threonine-protein kinase